MAAKLPAVVYFQRKARSVGNYSVEFIFDDVRNRLRNEIVSVVVRSRFESTGLVKRLYNCFEAVLLAGEVNHVTGDINYVGTFLSKRRTIHTILDCVFMQRPPGIRRSLLKFFWLTVPVKRSAYITAISQATKAEILRHVCCDPGKIVVIPVAISHRFAYRPKTFNAEKPIILQIGTAPNKNIPRLIAALKGISCRLHIIGKANQAYEELLRENKIEYNYTWGLNDQEMVNQYVEADIVSLISTYEGFGMPILEAQATGRPVITSSVLSMPEVAGDAACLVNPEDVNAIREGLMKIIHDQSFREGLVNKGLINIKRFEPNGIALQYLELYKKVSQEI